MAMSKRDKLGAIILVALMALLMVVMYFTANEPIGSGQYFDN